VIGYNERQEAENLLALLLESREKLTAFNAACAASDDEEARQCALTGCFLPLADWAEAAMNSGRYALCFTPADKVQRAPYDLLARLPLTEAETGALEGRDELFVGLDVQEAQRMRRLYYRLMCIQPLRTLLERLLALAALAHRKYDAVRLRQEQLRLTGNAAWRAEIPLCQDRRSGTTLQLQDHDFTIIDRLIDNRGRTLREDRGFALPVALMERTACPQTLMTAAIAHRISGNQEKQPYCAVPGGHTALGVYATGTPEAFFDEAAKDQQRRRNPVLRMRAYGRLRLVQVDDTAAVQLGKTRYDAARAALPMEQRKLFGAEDDGGRHILPQLESELRLRHELSDEECMSRFFKGEEQLEMQRVKAMRGLRAMAEDFFREPELPKNFNNDDPALFINVGRKKLRQRAVRMLIAHQAAVRMLREPFGGGQMPQSLRQLLDALEQSPESRSAFLQDVRSMGGYATKLNVRYENLPDGTRCMLVVRSPAMDVSGLEAWLREGGSTVLDFTPQALKVMCLYGLQRFLYYGQEVGTGAKAGEFSLAVSTGARRAPDVYFQLLCLWCAVRLGDGTAFLQPELHQPEISLLKTGNGDVRFVDLFAGTDTGALRFTPSAAAELVRQMAGLRLRITRQGDGFSVLAWR